MHRRGLFAKPLGMQSGRSSWIQLKRSSANAGANKNWRRCLSMLRSRLTANHGLVIQSEWIRGFRCLSRERLPFIVIVDQFSRMTVSGAVSDEAVQSALDFLSHRWITIFGRPSRLITANGSNFKGEISTSFAGVWNITHICNPAYSAYQGGVFERTVGMLKAGVHAIAKHDPSIQWIDAVSLAVAGRNLSPLLEFGLAPLTIMTGRRNILDFATDHDFVNGETACASIRVPRQETNLHNVPIARAAVIEYESREIIRKCLTRNLRARSEYEFRKNQPVQSWQGSQWLGGYRFLSISVGGN